MPQLWPLCTTRTMAPQRSVTREQPPYACKYWTPCGAPCEYFPWRGRCIDNNGLGGAPVAGMASLVPNMYIYNKGDAATTTCLSHMKLLEGILTTTYPPPTTTSFLSLVRCVCACTRAEGCISLCRHMVVHVARCAHVLVWTNGGLGDDCRGSMAAAKG